MYVSFQLSGEPVLLSCVACLYLLTGWYDKFGNAIPSLSERKGEVNGGGGEGCLIYTVHDNFNANPL